MSLKVPRFRTRWRGYDRSEVDSFLTALAEEHAQLRPNVAYVQSLLDHQRQGEATIQDLRKQMAARQQESDLRPATRDHLERVLTSVIAALQAAQTVLQKNQSSSHGASTLSPAAAPVPRDATATETSDAPRTHQFGDKGPSMRRAYAVVALCVLVAGLGVIYIKGATPTPRPTNAAPSGTRTVAPMTGPVPPSLPAAGSNRAGSSAAAVLPVGTQPVAEGLTVVLKAHALCWVATTLDGKQRTEYLLRPGEERMLHARHEVVLRVGNAGVLSLTVNGLVVSPLGRSGEVLTRRITPDNYKSMTSGPPQAR